MTVAANIPPKNSLTSAPSMAYAARWGDAPPATTMLWPNHFATYKKELIHTRPWSDLTEVQQHTFLWIEGYYNRRRRHSTLDYLTPLEYELGYRKLTDLAA
ncbi:MAG: integrase core domain-containing protein [Actinomycetota bacterium]|nr:integrase core domain-containing protein [Actinomycetota bacterium]